MAGFIINALLHVHEYTFLYTMGIILSEFLILLLN